MPDTEDHSTPAPGYPTPELELTADPDREAKISAAVARMVELNSKLETFQAVRLVADNEALLSYRAVEQIRDLYAAFDKKHPAPKGDQS